MQCDVTNAGGRYEYLFKSALRYKFLILITYYLDTVFPSARM